MKITSSAFEHNGSIPVQYTCDGDGVSPPLRFEEVPDGAVSLALIMDDPDVPESVRADRMWDHWIVFNIPPETREVAEGKEPLGVHGTGTAGNKDYHRPCPPDREHRYFFKLYVLDTQLDLPEGVNKGDVEAAMEGHVVAQAELIGRYKRQKL